MSEMSKDTARRALQEFIKMGTGSTLVNADKRTGGIKGGRYPDSCERHLRSLMHERGLENLISVIRDGDEVRLRRIG